MLTETNNYLHHGDYFHFEYALESQKFELEGEEYLGIGVSAKMVDNKGMEVIESISDITTKLEVAQELVHLLDLSKVSPMCLKMFIENFLNN